MMADEGKKATNSDALIAAMQAAWADHHHARDQTWKTLQMEAVLAAGLVTVDVQFHTPVATGIAALLVIIAALAGFMITLRHRELERRKFIHIMNCEEELALHRRDILPLTTEAMLALGVNNDEYAARHTREPTEETVASSEVSVPKGICLSDIPRFWKGSTSLFILRMHVALMAFSVVVFVARIIRG
jgi:hypothetical protein